MARTRLPHATPAVAAVLALGLGACAGGGGGPGLEPGSELMVADDPIATGGLVWADEEQVHLGDGSTIATEQPAEAFVLAGDGAWLVPATSDDEPRGTDLLLATPDGIVETGLHAEPDELLASDDGRYVAFVDLTSGPRDSYDTPLAEVVLLDTTTGAEVVRSSHGMGDIGSDDLADLYEDADGPGLYGFADGALYVATPDGVDAYDVETGDRSEAEGGSGSVLETAWYREIEGPDALANPAGTWRIVDPPAYAKPPSLVPDEGPAVPTTAPARTWTLTAWLDDETAAGYVIEGEPTPGALGSPPIESLDGDTLAGVVLLTCTVPTGDCAIVPGTEGGVLTPNGGWQLP